MGRIVVTCPATGEKIPTGIETDAATFARIAAIVGRAWCPHCKAEHEWSAAEAQFREEGR